MHHAGHQAGNYVLLERIGMGGMAEVFRAASRGVEGFERPVAIKRILPNLAADEDFVKMFVDEAKIAVQLQHPNIVEIFDLARAGDDLFIAMEYVHGKDLRAILDKVQGPDGRSGRIPVELAVHVTARICDALHHAHFAHGPSGQPLGIIHRDVSPQNVIVSFDGEVKVTDFGLAKAAGRAVQTQAGVVKGKLAYMSPEQLRGQPIDQRSDVYGVGILLWEMLTGVRLFLGKNDQETLRRVYHAQIPPPRSVRPELHPELEAITLRALAKEVADRYASAEEMQEDLTSFLYGVGPSISTPGVSAYMRQLFPQAEPVPQPSSHPPAAVAPARITARGLARIEGRRQPAPPVEQSEPSITNVPPRRREAASSPLRPGSVSQHAEGSPSRPPISLDDLEDLVEEVPESRPAGRVTRAIAPPADEGSELVRTVLHRAIASSTAQTRPPPGPEPVEEDTNRGYQLPRENEPIVFHQEVSITSQNEPRVFRRPGQAAEPRSASSLSAPRVPSIESLIEEALHDEAPGPTASFGQAYSPYPSAEARTASTAQAYAPYPDPPSDYDDLTASGQVHPSTGESDDFGDHPTMIGDEQELARLAASQSWDGELTPQQPPPQPPGPRRRS
ncbi:MAG: protein kinase [Sandaracinaceae bacterium]|nr:protein kinase [Sandaracinaceae bacterium]